MSFYDELFFRNAGTIDVNGQEKLKQATIAIVGLGGTGGFALENLVRAGIEKFIIFDFDRVELTNFNRQLLANFETLDSKKTDAGEKRAKSINPEIKIKKFYKRFSFSDFDKLKGCNLIVDCSDNIGTRMDVAKASKKLKTPFVFCSAGFSRGMVSVFELKVDFEKTLSIQKNKKYLVCESILCPAASLAGSLAAAQGINFLIEKPFVKAPEFLFFDLFGKEIFWKSRI